MIDDEIEAVSTEAVVGISRHGRVGVVTLNRPESLNAFNAAQRAQLQAAVAVVNADEELDVVVLTGAGRAFSAGADLTETKTEGFDVRVQIASEYKPTLMAISQAPKPWISAVGGAAAGIGSAFAMVCDLTVMEQSAYLYQAFTAISLVPDGGATWQLVHAVGRKRAYEFIATGEKVTAQKCFELGLCNRVVADGEALQQALLWAQELSEKAPLSLRYAKEAVNFACTADLSDTIDKEADLQHLCVNSEDAQEGVLAFMEKRAPKWQGR